MSILQKKGSNRRTPYTKTCGGCDKTRLIKRYSPVQGVPPKAPPTKVWVYEMEEPICMTVRDNVIEAIEKIRQDVAQLKGKHSKLMADKEREITFRLMHEVESRTQEFEKRIEKIIKSNPFRADIIQKLRWMNYKIHRVCPQCHGMKVIKNFQPCGYCNGEGCMDCDRTGLIYAKDSMCLYCNGSGINPNPEIDIHIDSNMDLDTMEEIYVKKKKKVVLAISNDPTIINPEEEDE